MYRVGGALVVLGLASVSATAADMPVKALQQVSAPVWTPTTTVYSYFDAVSYRSVFPGREFFAHAYQSTNGINYTVTPNWTVGAGAIYSWANSTLYYLGPGAHSDGDQLVGFLTTAYTIPNLFTVGGS